MTSRKVTSGGLQYKEFNESPVRRRNKEKKNTGNSLNLRVTIISAIKILL
jgi:hypothetical protein